MHGKFKLHIINYTEDKHILSHRINTFSAILDGGRGMEDGDWETTGVTLGTGIR